MAVQNIYWNSGVPSALLGASKEDHMKTVIAVVSAAFLVTSFGAVTPAAAKDSPAMAQKRKECKAEAARKYTEMVPVV
jgi:hypothetical protein